MWSYILFGLGFLMATATALYARDIYIHFKRGLTLDAVLIKIERTDVEYQTERRVFSFNLNGTELLLPERNGGYSMSGQPGDMAQILYIPGRSYVYERKAGNEVQRVLMYAAFSMAIFIIAWLI